MSRHLHRSHLRASPCFPAPQPHTLFGHLALLPAGLTRLELSCRCGGPLPAALQRFTALRALVVSGNGAEVEWGCRGGAAALARLSTLHLDCRLPEYELHGYGDDPLVEILPMGQSTQLPNELLQPLLAAALPRLRSAHLACSFGADVPRLCRHLAQQGALRELKCAGCGRICAVEAARLGGCGARWR